MNRDQFAHDEWYHCYNRGVDKRRTFVSSRDYERMQELLYLANSSTALHRSNHKHIVHESVFTIPRGDPLVSIAAYCLMPNHLHLLLKQEVEGGIPTFMRKLMTGYTMYFNSKHRRVGNLFYKPFRSRHVPDDRYGQHVYNYIHANPWELVRSKSKSVQIRFLETYPYSSLIDTRKARAASKIITRSQDAPFMQKSTTTLLSDALFFDENTAR